MAKYRITHETDYHYSVAVSHSQQLLHLRPRPLPYQLLDPHHGFSLHITPPPSAESVVTDCFGNPCTVLEFSRPHLRLSVSAETVVEVLPRPAVDFSGSPAWETVVAACQYHGQAISAGLLEALAYLPESPYVRVKHVFADFARPCFAEGRPLLEATSALMEKIFAEFTFDPDATQINTPVTQVLEQKRGVCQDFAHLMLSCLRSLGLPARYMSGYLLTEPPAGQERLIGADASHAWVAVYCPENGWIEFDPTNAVLPGLAHITLGWGRDFSDVSPLRGIILGGGEHALQVRVTVMPESEGS